MPVGQPEFIDNPEPRCPVVLLLDTSASMEGEPIRELNEGIVVFNESVRRDSLASLRVEVAIITFGETVQLVQDFVTVSQFYPPKLETNGRTPMGEAILYAFDYLEDRKITYRSNNMQYYQPWVFLITDGAPTDTWNQAAQRVNQAEHDKKLSFFAVGVKGANFDALRQITPPTRPPLMLKGLNFKGLFVWLSQSMSKVSSGKVGDGMTDLPPIGWGQAPR